MAGIARQVVQAGRGVLARLFVLPVVAAGDDGTPRRGATGRSGKKISEIYAFPGDAVKGRGFDKSTSCKTGVCKRLIIADGEADK
jgi:hypothetical protein